MAKDVSVIFRIDEDVVTELDQIVAEVGLGNRSDHLRKAVVEYIHRYKITKQIPVPA